MIDIFVKLKIKKYENFWNKIQSCILPYLPRRTEKDPLIIIVNLPSNFLKVFKKLFTIDNINSKYNINFVRNEQPKGAFT
jgi:hypothetical protein